MGKVKKLINEADVQRNIKAINYDYEDNSNLRRKKKKNSLTEQSFSCHDCGKAYKSKRTIRSHIRVVHEGYRFICRTDMCYTFFRSRQALMQHKLIHTGEKPLSCKVCNKTFRQQSALLRHATIHEGLRPYTCKVCQRAFTRKDHLRTHLKIHTGEKPHKCEVCQRAFTQKNSLRSHLKIHTGDKPYKCDMCQRAFTQKRYLTKHFRNHTGDKPFSCAHCGKKYIEKKSLKGHLVKCFRKHGFENQFKDHHPQQSSNDENPSGEVHICEVCLRGFKKKNEFVTHQKTHTKDKPFSCAHCGKDFIRKDALKRHLVKCFRKHGFENQFKDHHSQQSSNDENPSGEVHICEVCFRGFKKRNEFVTHQKTHTKYKTFECAHCGNDFLKKRSLKAHLVKCFSDYGFENQFQDI